MTRKSDPILRFFLVILIALPAMMLGAVHPAIQGGFFIVAALLLIYLFIIRKATPPRMDLGGILFLGLTLITILQLIPLPSSLVSFLAPAVFDIQSRALTPLDGEAPSFMPLTLDMPLTILEVGKLCLYTAVYFGVVYWTHRRGPGFVLRLVALTGMAAATVFIVHRILLMEKIYGFYTPIHVNVDKSNVSAPLINSNHLAGLLGLCTTVAIGCALAVSDRSKRLLLIGIAALAGGALILTFSRGGIAAFVTSQILFIVLRFISRQRHRGPDADRGHNFTWLPVGLALSLGLGFFVAQDALIGEFVNGDIKKLDMAFQGLPLIAQFWPTGVGRGSFGVSFQMVSSLAANKTATHAENAIVQILADYGIIVGGAALILAMIIIGAFLKSAPRRSEQAAALAGLVGFGIHNLVDFNSEIPGVAVIAAALLGVLSGSRSIRSHSRHNRCPHVLIGCSAAAGLVVGILSVTYVHEHNRDTEERRILTEWKQPNAPLFEKSAMRAALLRHPADWFIPYITGVRIYHLGTENPLPWLARAIELNPNSALAHLYIGGTLLKAGHLDQALLELRLAVRSKPELVTTVARLIVKKRYAFDDIAKIAVTRADKKLLWPAIARQYELNGFPKETEAADTAILHIAPLTPHSLARHIRRLTVREETGTALRLARKLATHPDVGFSGYLLEAEIYDKSGDHQQSLATLERGIAKFGNKPPLLKALAWQKQRSGDFNGAVKALKILKNSASTTEQRAAVVLLEANISEAAGRYQAALARLREAYALTPSNTKIVQRIADISRRKGDHRRALDALRTLHRTNPGDEVVKAQLEQLENKLKSE